MNERPTPETDAAVKASNGQWSFVLKETCQRLERERDNAISELSSTKYWLLKERDDAISKLIESEFQFEKLLKERDDARVERDYFADQFKEVQNEIFRLHNVISKQHKLLYDKEMEESII